MRIIHVLNEAVDTGNGIVNATVDLACTQSRMGHNVHVVSSGGGYINLLDSHGVRHHTHYLKPRPFLRMLRDLPHLRRTIKSLQPDIVHAHMMTGAILMRLGREIAGFGKFGLVTTIHNEWRTTSHLMRVGDRVLVLSENGRTASIQRGFPSQKLRVVSHGVLNSPRMDTLPPRTEPIERRSAAPIIVTMAGLYIRKGIGDLIQAFSQIADEFPRATLKIAGWGPAQKKFENLKKTVRGSERIHFIGFVPKPQTLLRQADIFVLASHTESFPLALAEARQAGCAVIGTTVGGVPELLENGRAGLLVPPHHVDALAHALRSLLESPQHLQYWRNAARKNLNRLSCARMEKETMDVYIALLGDRDVPKIAAE